MCLKYRKIDIRFKDTNYNSLNVKPQLPLKSWQPAGSIILQQQKKISLNRIRSSNFLRLIYLPSICLDEIYVRLSLNDPSIYKTFSLPKIDLRNFVYIKFLYSQGYCIIPNCQLILTGLKLMSLPFIMNVNIREPKRMAVVK